MPIARSVEGTAPGVIQGQFLQAAAISSTGDVDIKAVDGLPFVVVYNADTVTHVITARTRGPGQGGGAQTNVVFNLLQGQSVSLPVTVFSAFTDAQGGNGAAASYYFYSDTRVTMSASSIGNLVQFGSAVTGPTVIAAAQAEETLAQLNAVKGQVNYYSLSIGPVPGSVASPPLNYVALKGATSGTYYALALSGTLSGSFMVPASELVNLVARNANAGAAVNVNAYAEGRNQ